MIPQLLRDSSARRRKTPGESEPWPPAPSIIEVPLLTSSSGPRIPGGRAPGGMEAPGSRCLLRSGLFVVDGACLVVLRAGLLAMWPRCDGPMTAHDSTEDGWETVDGLALPSTLKRPRM